MKPKKTIENIDSKYLDLIESDAVGIIIFNDNNVIFANEKTCKMVGYSKSELTMDSLEIAKLTGKKHFHVLRDIRDMFEQLEMAKERQSKYEVPILKESINPGIKYNLPKNLTINLVS